MLERISLKKYGGSQVGKRKTCQMIGLYLLSLLQKDCTKALGRNTYSFHRGSEL